MDELDNNIKIKKAQIIMRITFGILLFVFVAGIFLAYHYSKKSDTETSGFNNTTAGVFDKLHIEAKSAFVYDINKHKVMYAKNKELQLPLASVTKIMTALVAREMFGNNQLVKISSYSIKPEGDSGLMVGEKWKLKDLIDFTLISSSNDGARAIASVGALSIKNKNEQVNSDYPKKEGAFIKFMNKKVKELGLKQTYYINESGLDFNGDVAGAYGSAKDMAMLFSYVLKKYPDLLEATSHNFIEVKSATLVHKAKNTNKIVEQIPGIIASKTGYTDLAGGNLIVAFDAGPERPIVISVLGSGVKGRFNDVIRLVNASLEQIKEN